MCSPGFIITTESRNFGSSWCESFALRQRVWLPFLAKSPKTHKSATTPRSSWCMWGEYQSRNPWLVVLGIGKLGLNIFPAKKLSGFWMKDKWHSWDFASVCVLRECLCVHYTGEKLRAYNFWMHIWGLLVSKRHLKLHFEICSMIIFITWPFVHLARVV